jgi:hypothetical protein
MELVEKACSVCGQMNCSMCINTLDVIHQITVDQKDEFRQVKKFRQQVRNESRKFKRSQRFV